MLARVFDYKKAIRGFFEQHPWDEFFGLEVAERLGMSQGAVYAPLRELVDEGVLESREGAPLAERGGRPRIYYRKAGAAVTDRE
ncbi:MAG: winged helix-turn-helix transcriptional regulator [Polyangiaceae bacterium]|nr:winged helix-turn-helix transcriptional regulator [Polyangiaceae bacterium]